MCMNVVAALAPLAPIDDGAGAYPTSKERHIMHGHCAGNSPKHPSTNSPLHPLDLLGKAIRCGRYKSSLVDGEGKMVIINETLRFPSSFGQHGQYRSQNLDLHDSLCKSILFIGQ